MTRAAFAALALAFAPLAAHAEDAASTQPASAVDHLPRGQDVSETVIQLASWVVSTRDNLGYPFAIIDKGAGQVLVFGADGRLRGAAPALFGSAVGDHTVEGIAGMALRDIPPADRTTPAGRFVGGFGPATTGERTLWIDYDSAVSIHAVTGPRSERREARLASPTPDDNRISHGCINVTAEFFETVVSPTFQRGGLFYILPDERPLAEVFPDFAQAYAASQGGERRRGRRNR